jgi:hypothetical protein
MLKIFLSIILFFVSATANADEKIVFSTGEGATIQDISELVLIEAYNKIGYDVEVKRLPNARALMSSNFGKVDGEVSRVKGINKKFVNLIQIPIAINYLEGYAFSKKSSLEITNWESLRKYKLVCVRGVKFVEANLSKRSIDCHEVTLFTQAVKLLQMDRFEAAVFPRTNGISAIREAKVMDIKPVGKPLIKTKLYHYLHKKNANMVIKIQTVLEEMEKSGRIAEIRADYIEKNRY